MKIMSSLIFSLLISLSASAEVVDKIIAVINEEIVTESDLRGLAERAKQPTLIDEALLFGQKVDALRTNRQLQLSYLINERIMESEIKRLNLSVSTERVDQEIRDIARKNGATKADLFAALKGQGVSVSTYQDFIKSRIERQSLIDTEIASRIRVGEEEIQNYYVQNYPVSNTAIYQYDISHIFFNPKKGGPKLAEERARAALVRLSNGDNFDSVAEQTSEDSNFSNGGFLGVFKASELTPEFEKAISAVTPGAYTGLVVSRSGIHILKLNSKKLITDPKYEKEKEKIRGILFEQAFSKHLANWLETKKEDSFIRVNK